MRTAALICLLTVTIPVARPADNDSPESVVKAVYTVISGPAGTRDWVRFRSLFAGGARLITMRARTDGTAVAAVMTPDDYSTRAGANFEKAAFYESELARRWKRSATSRMFSAPTNPGGLPARSRSRAGSIVFNW